MAGYREFQTGEVLTAANVNSFLMEQATMTFADAAARDAALASVLREGLLTYNLDTNRLEVYDGTAWVEPAPEPPAPPAGIGSNVVQAAKLDTFSSNVGIGSSVTVTGLTCTITPTSATSKILVFVDISGGTENNNAGMSLLRNGSAISIGNTAGSRPRLTAHMVGNVPLKASLIVLDSPATTSAVSYTISLYNTRTIAQVLSINRTHGDSDNAQNPRTGSRITAIEVAA